MKKRPILLALLLVVGCLTARADGGDEPHQAPKQWTVGVVGGRAINYHSVDVSYMENFKYDKWTGGSAFGIRANYYPLRWLSVRADLAWVQKNYNMTHTLVDGTDTLNLSTHTTNDYLSLPMVAQFSFGRTVRVFAYGGGYVGCWLRCRRQGTTLALADTDLKNSGYNFNEEVEFSKVRDNRFDAGLTWGGGLSGTLAGKMEMGIEARWYYGLTDIQKDYTDNLGPRRNTTLVIQASLSYWL